MAADFRDLASRITATYTPEYNPRDFYQQAPQAMPQQNLLQNAIQRARWRQILEAILYGRTPPESTGQNTVG